MEFQMLKTGFQVVFHRPEASLKTSEKTSEKILFAISQDSLISSKRLAKMIGISERAIEYHIQALKQKGLLKRIGPDKGGHWKTKK